MTAAVDADRHWLHAHVPAHPALDISVISLALGMSHAIIIGLTYTHAHYMQQSRKTL